MQTQFDDGRGPRWRCLVTLAIVFLAAILVTVSDGIGDRADAASMLPGSSSFKGQPPLAFRVVTTPQGMGAVRLQMTRNPQQLWVYSGPCETPQRRLLILPNDHSVKMLLQPVRPGTCVTVRITGVPLPVAGQLWY
jgi:hypothetical protein